MFLRHGNQLALSKETSRVKKLPAIFLGLLTCMMCSVSVFASEVSSGTTQVSTALNSAFTEITSSMLDMVVSILPVVLPIVGAVTLIKFGINIFKKVTAKSN